MTFLKNRLDCFTLAYIAWQFKQILSINLSASPQSGEAALTSGFSSCLSSSLLAALALVIPAPQASFNLNVHMRSSVWILSFIWNKSEVLHGTMLHGTTFSEGTHRWLFQAWAGGEDIL